MPRGKPNTSPKILYKGEEKSFLQHSKDCGVDRRTLEERYKQHQKGLMTLDDVFQPVTDQPTSVGLCPGQDHKKIHNIGIRPRLTQKFLEAFEKNVLPGIDDEMLRFKDTDELGPCLKFFQMYAAYFPKGENEMLDGVGGAKQTANIAVIFTGKPDDKFNISDYKVIDQ